MKNCYYCGEKAESKEHVPPKSFFPSGLRKRLITVPSCDKHNSLKSKDDEYVRLFLIGMSKNINNDSCKKLKKLQKKSIDSIVRNPSLLNLIVKEPKYHTQQHDNAAISFLYDQRRVYSFFLSVAKGLYFHHHHAQWSGNATIHPHFLISEQSDEMIEMEESIVSESSCGDNKEVFYYKVKETEEKTYIGICLYSEFKVSLIFRG